MKSANAFVGARGIDSVQFSQTGTAAQAKALKASGIDFVFGYLGLIDAARLAYILDAGMAFMPVTLANHFDGPAAVAQLHALKIPAGVTVWLDLEGKPIYDLPAPEVMRKVEGFNAPVRIAGYMPGLYVGSPQPLTSEELYKLSSVRYWNALSRETDRFGKLAEPRCGWCVWQMTPSRSWAGVWSDINIIGEDFQGRLPVWAVA